MAKTKAQERRELVLNKIKDQIAKHLERHATKMFSVLDDAESETVTFGFAGKVDCSEPGPVVSTRMIIKEKASEDGGVVSKSHRWDETCAMDDPDQPGLPGTETESAPEPDKPKRGRKKKAEAAPEIAAESQD